MEETLTTKTVIFFTVNEVPDDFVAWLNSQMEGKGWGIRETARRAGVSHPVISDILNLRKKPSFETCKALAELFEFPPEYVMRLAGLLQQLPNRDPDDEEMLHLFGQLDEGDQEEILQIARLKIARRNQGKLSVKSNQQLSK